MLCSIQLYFKVCIDGIVRDTLLIIIISIPTKTLFLHPFLILSFVSFQLTFSSLVRNASEMESMICVKSVSYKIWHSMLFWFLITVKYKIKMNWRCMKICNEFCKIKTEKTHSFCNLILGNQTQCLIFKFSIKISTLNIS